MSPRISKADPKFYRVKWIDAFGPTVPWTDVKELDLEPCHCMSHGYLVAKTRQYYVFAPHVSGSGDVCGDIKIPKQNIVTMTELVERAPAKRKPSCSRS